MLKYIWLIAGILFAASMTNLALAYPTNGKQHRMYKGSYKGEQYLAPMPAPEPQAPHFSFGGGGYVGFSLGGRTNITSTPVAYRGIEGILTAGYGILLTNGFYIAEEIFVSDGFQVQNYNDSAESAKSSWSIGLSVLPGYLILDNLIGYLRLGVVKTHFSSDGSSNGGQMGLGLEAALTESWDLRGEYIYSFYQSTAGCNPAPGTLGSVKSDQFNIGLMYKFM